MIIRKVIKTGNSLAVTVPSKCLKDFAVQEGDIVQIKINRPRSSVTYFFTGHPRQLSLIDKNHSKA